MAITAGLHLSVDLGAVADFAIAPQGGGTKLMIHYSCMLNFMGRLMKGYTDKQMTNGTGGMAKALQRESEGASAAPNDLPRD
ncbi:MAG: hypothetical protein O2992_07365 [Gemmatimonadetes bacterium]|jgi:hypothetical protein|nr:hypothetical protein [Gemmatimonadota bacterium]